MPRYPPVLRRVAGRPTSTAAPARPPPAQHAPQSARRGGDRRGRPPGNGPASASRSARPSGRPPGAATSTALPSSAPESTADGRPRRGARRRGVGPGEGASLRAQAGEPGGVGDVHDDEAARARGAARHPPMNDGVVDERRRLEAASRGRRPPRRTAAAPASAPRATERPRARRRDDSSIVRAGGERQALEHGRDELGVVLDDHLVRPGPGRRDVARQRHRAAAEVQHPDRLARRGDARRARGRCVARTRRTGASGRLGSTCDCAVPSTSSVRPDGEKTSASNSMRGCGHACIVPRRACSARAGRPTRSIRRVVPRDSVEPGIGGASARLYPSSANKSRIRLDMARRFDI